MKTPNITKGPWEWQKFGDKHYLTGQHGMRPIVLGTLDNHITTRENGILNPLDPNHPDATAIKAVPDMIDQLLSELEFLDSIEGFFSKSFEIKLQHRKTSIKKALIKAGVEL